MTGAGVKLGERVLHLRRAFDRVFAEVPRAPIPLSDFLAIRVGSDPYALRLDDVAGIFTDRTITPLPTTAAGLLGMAGVRGAVVPVYDLRALLGHPSSDAPRWLVLIAGRPVALAFDAFDKHLRLPHDEASVDGHAEQARQHLHGAVREGNLLRPILHVASILNTIEQIAHQES